MSVKKKTTPLVLVALDYQCFGVVRPISDHWPGLHRKVLRPHDLSYYATRYGRLRPPYPPIDHVQKSLSSRVNRERPFDPHTRQGRALPRLAAGRELRELTEGENH